MRSQNHKKLFRVESVAIALLLSGILFALWINIQSLYTYPVPNSWIYWSGDETQAMSESKTQIGTGIYAYPFAVGSIFSEGSGIIKGSVWLSSLIYGGLALILHSNPVDVGRTVSFGIGVLLLIAIYVIARRNLVNRFIALGTILLFVTTPCDLIMSHCARYDIFVGTSILIIIAMLIEKKEITGTQIGLLAIGGVLVSAHVWIDCAVAVLCILWLRGLWKWRIIVPAACITVAGILVLSIVYIAKAGTFDLLGPFDHVSIPLYRFFSPGAQRGNLLFRWFIVEQWSPSYIWFAVPILLLSIYLVVKTKLLDRTFKLWLVAITSIAASIAYLEAIVPRYYIYLIPCLTILLAIAAQRGWEVFSHRTIRIAIGTACALLLVFNSYRYTEAADSTRQYANTLCEANRAALQSVESILDRDTATQKRIIASTPALFAIGDWKRIAPIVPLFLDAPTVAWTAQHKPLWTRADYLLTYNSERVPGSRDADNDYIPLLSMHLDKVLERVGHFTDIGRSYAPDGVWGMDTIRLYRITQ